MSLWVPAIDTWLTRAFFLVCCAGCESARLSCQDSPSCDDVHWDVFKLRKVVGPCEDEINRIYGWLLMSLASFWIYQNVCQQSTSCICSGCSTTQLAEELGLASGLAYDFWFWKSIALLAVSYYWVGSIWAKSYYFQFFKVEMLMIWLRSEFLAKLESTFFFVLLLHSSLLVWLSSFGLQPLGCSVTSGLCL